MDIFFAVFSSAVTFVISFVFDVFLKHRNRLKKDDVDPTAYLYTDDNRKRIKVTIDNSKNIIFVTKADQIVSPHSKFVKLARKHERLSFLYAISSILVRPEMISGEKPACTKIKEEDNLIMSLLEKKVQNTTKVCYALFGVLLIEFIFAFVLPKSFSRWVVIFACFFILLCNIGQWILEYRVKHGLYGTNSTEAREIILYIINNVDNSTNGKNGMRLVFPRPEYENAIIKNGGEVRV